MDTKHKLNYLLAIATVLSGATVAGQAQLHVAGDLLINIDATTNAVGALTSITNNGTLGGYFEAKGAAGEIPTVAAVNGNGTLSMRFDGNDFLQQVATAGGPVVSAAPTLTGLNPTCSIEVWVLNPNIAREETIVAWGHRGDPAGANMSFNYGWDARFGAVGHWGGADIGWDSCCDADLNPQGVPVSGVWHHLVYTFDGTTQRVYADGVLKNSENVSLNTFTVPPVTIGAQMATDTVVEPGLRGLMSIAKLRIHSEALSASQISSNYTFEVASISNGGNPLPVGPIHRYSFNNPAGPAGAATITDSIGTAHGTVLGSGANFTGTRLTLPGGSSGSAGYVDLPNLLLSTNSADNGGSGKITIEGWVKNTGTRNWGRVWDFGNGTAGEITGPGGSAEGRDYWFLSGTEGTNPQRHNTSIRNLIPPTGSDQGNGWDTANANRDYHFAVTWDEATGAILAYENGSLAGGLQAAVGDRFSTIQDVNVWLGRSNWTGDENFQGEYDEFRIYNVVLPPDQVRASYAAGPNTLATADPVFFTAQPSNQSAPEFGSATFSAGVQGQPPIAVQWYKNNLPLGGAIALTLNLSNIPFSDNGSTYYLVASNYISPNIYYATSQVVTLTVVPDTTPPTVVSGQLNASNVVELVFSEDINPADLPIAANYTITGAGAPSVVSATIGANNRRVILTLSSGVLNYEFYVVTAANLRDASAAANVMVPPGNTATIWSYVLANLKHRWTFNDGALANASGASVVDVVGGADGIIRGGTNPVRPVSLDGGKVILSGGPGTDAPYVDLTNGLVSVNSTNNAGSGQVTLEGWVRVTGNQSWSRIFDFGATDIGGGVGGEVFGPGPGAEGRDYLFYAAQTGGNTANRRIDRSNRDEADFGTVGAEYGIGNFGQQFHFAVTWDEATGQIRVYEDAVLRASMVTAAPMSSLNDVNVWLGRSVWTVDANLQGEFNEFRTYNRVLTASEIALNKAAGPDNVFGALTSLNLIAGTNTTGTNQMVTNSVANVTLLGVFSGIGTQNLAAAAGVVYSSSDSNVVYITPDGVIHSVDAGFASVTATLGGLSDTEYVEVTQDASPPTLVRARANGIRTIEIQFSEPVDLGTAEEPSSYVVSGPSGLLDVDTVTRLADQSRVVVTLLQAMPCEYITVLVSFVADQSPLFNQIAENSPVSFFHYTPAGLQHRYTFNNPAGAGPSGTVVADTLETGHGAVLGAGATFTGDKVVLPGGGSGVAAYVDLPNYMVSSNGTLAGGSGKLTLEGWVKITGSQNWGRIFDIGSSQGGEVFGPGGGGEGRDYLMLSASIGTDVNVRRVELRNEDPGGGGIRTVDHGTAGFNNYTHFVMTWDEAAAQIRTYENGALVSTLSGLDDRMTDLNDVNVWLGRSNWTGDANAQGEFDDFRVYNRIMGTNELALNASMGPDNNLGQPLALRIGATNHVQLGQAFPVSAIVDFSTRSNVDLTFCKCATLQSSDSTVVAVNGGPAYAVGVGTATLTMNFSGFTTNLVVTVGYRFQLAGTPGLTYSIQTAPQVTGPWTTIGSAVASPGGVIGFEDAVNRGSQAFYRAVSP